MKAAKFPSSLSPGALSCSRVFASSVKKISLSLISPDAKYGITFENFPEWAFPPVLPFPRNLDDGAGTAGSGADTARASFAGAGAAAGAAAAAGGDESSGAGADTARASFAGAGAGAGAAAAAGGDESNAGTLSMLNFAANPYAKQFPSPTNMYSS